MGALLGHGVCRHHGRRQGARVRPQREQAAARLLTKGGGGTERLAPPPHTRHARCPHSRARRITAKGNVHPGSRLARVRTITIVLHAGGQEGQAHQAGLQPQVAHRSGRRRQGLRHVAQALAQPAQAPRARQGAKGAPARPFPPAAAPRWPGSPAPPAGRPWDTQVGTFHPGDSLPPLWHDSTACPAFNLFCRRRRRSSSAPSWRRCWTWRASPTQRRTSTPRRRRRPPTAWPPTRPRAPRPEQAPRAHSFPCAATTAFSCVSVLDVLAAPLHRRLRNEP